MNDFKLVNRNQHLNGKRAFQRQAKIGHRLAHHHKLARLLGSESKAELHWQAELAKRLGKGGKIIP